MEFKKIILIIAIFMALSITLTMKIVDEEDNNNNNATTPTRNLVFNEEKKIGLPSKRISRFLAEEKNPRAADHCNKDNDVCFDQVGSQQNATTCCNNKCIDLKTDNKNCGACKNKCKYTETCCRGQCVYLAYDKRHCGKCNSRCTTGSYCNYGMCDYA